MSDQALRSKIIRLAHTNPALRPHLLPLITKTAADEASKLETAKKDLKNFLSKVEKVIESLREVKSPEGADERKKMINDLRAINADIDTYDTPLNAIISKLKK